MGVVFYRQRSTARIAPVVHGASARGRGAQSALLEGLPFIASFARVGGEKKTVASYSCSVRVETNDELKAESWCAYVLRRVWTSPCPLHLPRHGRLRQWRPRDERGAVNLSTHTTVTVLKLIYGNRGDSLYGAARTYERVATATRRHAPVPLRFLHRYLRSTRRRRRRFRTCVSRAVAVEEADDRRPRRGAISRRGKPMSLPRRRLFLSSFTNRRRRRRRRRIAPLYLAPRRPALVVLLFQRASKKTYYCLVVHARHKQSTSTCAAVPQFRRRRRRAPSSVVDSHRIFRILQWILINRSGNPSPSPLPVVNGQH